MYSDFHLSFYFRCPNLRNLFQTCGNTVHDKVNSPQNWGNSGVKILDPSGYEVQIMDSAGFTLPTGTNPLTVITGVAVPGDPPFYFCAGNLGSKLMLGDICGAIYHTAVPVDNPVLAAVNKPPANPSDPPTYKPGGQWNKMDIFFMSARYKRNAQGKWDRKKCSTILVVLNSVLVHNRVGLVPLKAGGQLFNETARLICDFFYDEPNNPKGYCKASGIILFQEHDNAVEFKDIWIDPWWKPDRDWQKEGGCLQRAD
jgi:hypothetical protein